MSRRKGKKEKKVIVVKNGFCFSISDGSLLPVYSMVEDDFCRGDLTFDEYKVLSSEVTEEFISSGGLIDRPCDDEQYLFYDSDDSDDFDDESY